MKQNGPRFIPTDKSGGLRAEQPGKGWRVQVVPETPGCFESYIKLPEAWRGLDEGALRAVTGIEDAVFCAKAGWIAGAKTREGAVKMAEKALGELG